jgi:hypothetical protein
MGMSTLLVRTTAWAEIMIMISLMNTFAFFKVECPVCCYERAFVKEKKEVDFESKMTGWIPLTDSNY